ncbi:hypothetical protein HNR55_000032 [Acetobacter lovaniensis]|uniref:Uncharacterized protein n=1 Tax=Acetobacter lovaniensis TaxID=104100 RepID=A0A841QAC3_9PROT|nr:hypothetical protein [Acetobacter lovaniensis]
MSALLLFGAEGCTLLCGVLCYLSSRHQCIFTCRPNPRFCQCSATGLGVLAVCLLGSVESTQTACFMVVLLLMIVCSFFPLLVVVLQSGKKGHD